VASRADLKVDLVQELERQRQILMSFRNNPEISEEALAGALYEIEQASTGLLAMAGKIGPVPARERVADEHPQPRGDPGRRCASSTCRPTTTGSTATRLRRRDLDGLDPADGADPRRPRDRAAPAARQRPPRASGRDRSTATVNFELTLCNL
jgi:hypothetical protein